MKRLILLLAGMILLAGAGLGQGDLERSHKMTLFIFPIQYGMNAQGVTSERRAWIEDQMYETFVSSFQRFDFIEMPEGADLQTFLDDARGYMEEHAKEFVQKRKEPDGRIGEAMVTLDDLVLAIESGYVFVPVFDKIKQVTKKDDKGRTHVEFEVESHFDIYRTSDKTKVGRLHGGTSGAGALLGAMRGMLGVVGDGALSEVERKFRSTITGVFDEIKTNIRKMEEFSLKAQVLNSSINGFSFDLGRDFGVQLDKRFKVWELNKQGRRTKQLAFGKVRKIKEKESRAQLLIGSAPRGAQVIEDAKFGLNIGIQLGTIPLETKGFDDIDGVIFTLKGGRPDWIIDLPEDKSADRLWLGLNLEYNIAWLVGISELYTTAEGGYVPVAGLNVYNAMAGLEKKFYFRRLALFGTVKYGIFGVKFIDTDFFDDPDVEEADDAQIWGIGADIGAELLLSSTVALQGRVGWVGFPEQYVITVYDVGDGSFKHASVRAVGLTYKLALSFTI